MTDDVLACPLLGLNHSGSPQAQKSSWIPVQPSRLRKVPKVQITKHRRLAPTQFTLGRKPGREKSTKSLDYETQAPTQCILKRKPNREKSTKSQHITKLPIVATNCSAALRNKNVNPTNKSKASQNSKYMLIYWKPIGMQITEQRSSSKDGVVLH